MKRFALPIRQKIGILLLVVTLGYTAINHAVDRATLRPSFLNLERQQTLLDLRRCEEALRREAHHLSMLVGDWAFWDDTYEFMDSRNQDYIDANLYPESIYGNQTDLIAFFDVNRELVWGQAHDVDAQHRIPLSELIDMPLPQHLQCVEPIASRSGFAVTRRGAMIIAAQPILMSDGTGPPRGTLVKGRVLRPTVLDDLRAQTGVPFRVTTTEAIDERSARIFSLIREGGGIHLELDDPYVLTAHTELMDLSANPALVLSFDAPRVFMQKQREVLRSTFLSTLVGGLLILLCLLMLLSRVVIRPMQDLAAQVTGIGASGDRTARLELSRSDEIGMVAREFNALLARVEQDFNTREAATAALSASEKRLSTLLDAAPNAVLMLDVKGRIETANPAGAELFGLPLEDLQGKPLSELLPDAPFHAPSAWTPVEDGDHAFRGEVAAVRGDGVSFPAYMVLRGFELEHETHRIAVITDLTEFKRMHAAVLRAQHLASLGEMGATVAHELRNPIAGISNAVEIMRDTLPADSAHHETLEEMKRQAMRMERTVRSLLDFARPWQVAPENLALTPFVRDTWEAVQQDLNGGSVEIAYQGDEGIAALVDPGLMEQVLRNVFENAIQAMAGTGRIRIEVANGRDTVTLRVIDTGPGVPEGVQARVFQPFFTTRTTGVGLGLAVSRTLVEAQGGHMTMANDRHAGAVVTIELPAGEAAS